MHECASRHGRAGSYRVRSFVTRTDSLAIYAESSHTLSTADGAVRASAARVSPALFQMLGVQAALGRTLDESGRPWRPTRWW